MGRRKDRDLSPAPWRDRPRRAFDSAAYRLNSLAERLSARDRSLDASRRADDGRRARSARPNPEPFMTPIPLYGQAITDAIAGGDLDQLRKLQTLAESHLEEHGDIGALLAQIKVEIAKLKR